MSLNVLVIEPNEAVRDAMRTHFSKHRMEMSVWYSAATLVERVERERPSAIVMRAGPGYSDTYASLRQLRAAGYDMPVVLIGDEPDVSDKVLALEFGADDFLSEPVNLLELSTRIRTIVHRPIGAAANVIQVPRPRVMGHIEIDFAARRASKRGRDLGLRPSEFALLKAFVNHPLQVLSRATLLQLLQVGDESRSERGLDVLVFRLRALIEDNRDQPRHIQTMRGRGYIFVPPPDERGALADAVAA
ncbi:MAG: response regulator transcription factor [Burkholderia gladioli]